MLGPLVSCIVPTHNGERYIAETLRSILAQTYAPLEAIVVNDGSNDRTVEIVESFGEPVRILSQSRGGPAAARNLGIVSSRGEFIAFLDHDDLWLPEKLAQQMAAFDADPRLDVCVGHIQRFESGALGKMHMLGAPVPGFITITMLAKRAAFDKVGLLDASREHSDSAEWFLRAEDHGLLVRLLRETVTLHRTHQTNRSRTHGERSRQEFLRLARARIEKSRMRGSNAPPERTGGGQ
jgi:glycosyltransferase involved in cell wall biosynthesis